MTKNKTPNKPSTKPVIYVHAKGHAPVNPDQVHTLLELGLPLLSRLKIDGATQTENGYDQPAHLLSELAMLFPDRPVIFLRAGLQPSGIFLDQLTRIMDQADQPLVLSALSNAETSTNPFAGLQAPEQKTEIDLEGMVNLLAPGNLHTLTEWTDHFAYLSAEAVGLLAEKPDSSTLMQQLLAVGGKLKVPDHLFIHDPDSRVFEKLSLQPHESVYPPPFSELSARLQEWINSGIAVLPVAPGAGKPASLHITHSWGGGIAQWIKSFIETDSKHTHYQLRSENTQSNSAFGQKLSLYAGNELRCPIANWWLQPPIESIADTDVVYENIVSDICNRFEIGRVIVSSLIGHSLDALRTGLPTVQILHDHFPIWPMLGVNPEPYISGETGADLGKALSEHKKSRNFQDKDNLTWSQIRESYLQALTKFDVKVAAPGQWVLDLQNRLDSGFARLTSKVIPHGYPALPGLKPITPKPREDGRLRMVILGRMQEGKGQKLLSLALPGLAEYVQVYLLGTGKPGEAFFGVPGVDVVIEYDRDELGGLLGTIGPDFAALLSVVPETFSYTLSELQQLGIPAIATRVGSFPDRVVHGETGWLVNADANAVVNQVAALCREPGQIDSVRQKLPSIKANTPRKMVNAYNQFCPPAKTVQAFTPTEAEPVRVQWAAADYQYSMTDNKLRIALSKHSELAHEVELRTEWAQKTAHALKQEQIGRKKWVRELQKALKQEQKDKKKWVGKLQKALKQEQNDKKKWAGELQQEIDRLTEEFEARTAWALDLKQDLEHEQRLREIWVDQLEVEISLILKALTETQQHLQETQDQLQETRLNFEDSQLNLEETRLNLEETQLNLEETQLNLEETQLNLEDKHIQLDKLESDYQLISEEKALILSSTSWKITRPLRASRRVAKNLMLARAWNPLRWPWLLSSLIRNLHTLGVAGTLQRMQKGRSELVPIPRTEIGVEPLKETVFEPSTGDVSEAGTEDISETGAEEIAEPSSKLVSEYDPEIEPKLIDNLVTPGPFVVSANPDVSIVIPVYNKWAYTAACLSSLLEVKCKYSFEVIVIDDQSSDETADQLAKIKGITYLRNEQNLGFVGSCNRGAKHARGEYLVLLNNDTQVTDAWLDELIDTFDLEPGIGMVGSRLVYPDGKQQESGGIIFNDASGWNYGRGDDAENPEYHFLREVDYCSGACIALKTAYFHELGGLDERYSPAYYEDTDLAFKVRESGYKVMVQPCSVIIHHEGVTSGTDTSSGTKKFQLINQEKFLERWKSELEAQPGPVSNPYDRLAIRKTIHHRNKGQILFIDAHTPEPDQDSGSVRLTNLMQTCRELGYGVTFFADNRAYAGNYTRDLQKTGIEVLYHPWLASLSDFFRSRGHEFDHIFISRHYVATNYVLMLKRYCPNARFIFDTVDLHYLREQRLAELEKSRALKMAAQQTKRAELSVIKAADATLVVSSVEKDVLAVDAPDARVHILSNIHHVPGRDKGFSERKDIYFVGGYQHPPNIDAACWFVNDVWPLIREQLPEMRFHLIGSKAPERVRSLKGDGVVFHGYVESLQPFLDDCRLAIAPLRYGAGVKGKVNMSMAHGQPMVVTSVAGEGLFAEHEREFLIAEDAESFAREVVRLYQDEALWYKLSDASIKNVETHFSVQAARDSILSLFETIPSKS